LGQTAQVETRTGAAPTWREAFDGLVASEPRSVEEWTQLATLAYLTRPDDWDDWSARAVEACLAAGARPAAARCAFWLGFGLVDEGRTGRGAGWMARADELLGDLDCAERGLLLAPAALGLLESGDAAKALERFVDIVELGERHADADVATMGRLGRGQALVQLGDRESGVALMDQAMVAVESDSLSPQAAGLVTCGAIVTCQRLLEIARAQEWVFALSTWCDAHADLVPYRGQCLVHRAELLRMRGSWPEAAAAAEAACTWLDGAPAVGDAWYERGELHRLRGEHDAAEAAYRRASKAGRDPQPGLAFLRLEQGDVAAATGSIRRLADEARGQVERARALAPYVEISLAAGHLADARTGADELTRIAGRLGGPLMRATASTWEGAVLLAEGEPARALRTLRRAWRLWHDLGAPYDAARVRLLAAEACARLGDTDGAEMELDAARSVLHDLGAPAEPRWPRPPRTDESALTTRETEVLVHVARGLTNREVAAQLFISDKTVARHLSNVFAKLDLASRAAATAWAYEHGVVHRH
jgi:DNA-binding NarL/FixJ family response regulator